MVANTCVLENQQRASIIVDGDTIAFEKNQLAPSLVRKARIQRLSVLARIHHF
jgi:hypothetical protein